MITGSCHCGKVTWSFDGQPGHATACNCTICRRYGAIWAYDWLGERIATRGATETYLRGDRDIAFHRCTECGCVTWWQGANPHPDGRIRIAVNLRMADEAAGVAGIPVNHFDGFESWTNLPEDGATVHDLWF